MFRFSSSETWQGSGRTTCLRIPNTVELSSISFSCCRTVPWCCLKTNRTVTRHLVSNLTSTKKTQSASTYCLLQFFPTCPDPTVVRWSNHCLMKKVRAQASSNQPIWTSSRWCWVFSKLGLDKCTKLRLDLFIPRVFRRAACSSLSCTSCKRRRSTRCHWNNSSRYSMSNAFNHRGRLCKKVKEGLLTYADRNSTHKTA